MPRLDIRRICGVDDEEFVDSLRDGACDICGNVNKDCRLAVDHDHTTNRVRGVLCTRCNTRLREEDSLAEKRWLIKARNYIEGSMSRLGDYCERCEESRVEELWPCFPIAMKESDGEHTTYSYSCHMCSNMWVVTWRTTGLPLDLSF